MKPFLVLLITFIFLAGCAEKAEPALDATATAPDSAKESSPREPAEEIIAEPEAKTHEIKITDAGFVPLELTIQPGDKVTWKNVRTGRYTKTQIIGTRNCLEVKSPIFDTGGEFSWTFTAPRSCIIIDSIMQTDNGKIIVEAPAAAEDENN